MWRHRVGPVSRPAERVELSPEEREALVWWAKGGERRTQQRARIILLAAEGFPNRHIAGIVGLNPNQVGMWRKRYVALGREGLFDRPRMGRPHR